MKKITCKKRKRENRLFLQYPIYSSNFIVPIYPLFSSFYYSTHYFLVFSLEGKYEELREIILQCKERDIGKSYYSLGH